MTDSKESHFENPEGEKLPDRPIECTECKKPIAYLYTEIFGETIIQHCMCADCPILQRKLHGTPHVERASGKTETTGLVCGNCGTSLDSIRMGTALGCDVCYEVFEDILLNEMLAANKLPPRRMGQKKTIHIGRSPGESREISPSVRLLALNEALNETLKSEDYEQAAWLRDQIKALTEKNPEANNDNKKQSK